MACVKLLKVLEKKRFHWQGYRLGGAGDIVPSPSPPVTAMPITPAPVPAFQDTLLPMLDDTTRQAYISLIEEWTVMLSSWLEAKNQDDIKRRDTLSRDDLTNIESWQYESICFSSNLSSQSITEDDADLIMNTLGQKYKQFQAQLACPSSSSSTTNQPVVDCDAPSSSDDDQPPFTQPYDDEPQESTHYFAWDKVSLINYFGEARAMHLINSGKFAWKPSHITGSTHEDDREYQTPETFLGDDPNPEFTPEEHEAKTPYPWQSATLGHRPRR